MPAMYVTNNYVCNYLNLIKKKLPQSAVVMHLVTVFLNQMLYNESTMRYSFLQTHIFIVQPANSVRSAKYLSKYRPE